MTQANKLSCICDPPGGRPGTAPTHWKSGGQVAFSARSRISSFRRASPRPKSKLKSNTPRLRIPRHAGLSGTTLLRCAPFRQERDRTVAQPRLSMRKIREVLPLVLQVSDQAIAASVGCSRSTVQECLKRARQADLKWSLPGDFDDAHLETRLYPRAAAASTNQAIEPDFGEVAREVARKHMTRMQLWTNLSKRIRRGSVTPPSACTSSAGDKVSARPSLPRRNTSRAISSSSTSAAILATGPNGRRASHRRHRCSWRAGASRTRSSRVPPPLRRRNNGSEDKWWRWERLGVRRRPSYRTTQDDQQARLPLRSRPQRCVSRDG